MVLLACSVLMDVCQEGQPPMNPLPSPPYRPAEPPPTPPDTDPLRFIEELHFDLASGWVLICSQQEARDVRHKYKIPFYGSPVVHEGPTEP